MKENLDFRNAVKGLANDTLDAGYGKLYGIDKENIKDYGGETDYFDSLTK